MHTIITTLGATPFIEHFTLDNTSGYTQPELNALNRELSERIQGYELYTLAFFDTIHAFENEVASRRGT